MNKKKAPQKSRAEYSISGVNGNSTGAQRQRLLKTLQQLPVDTVNARNHLDISHPAGRVQELPDQGYEIATHWWETYTTGERLHRVDEYVLVSQKTKGGEPCLQ